MNFKKSIAAAIVTGSILATVLPAAAFAAGGDSNTCTISGNGINSWNKCKIKVETTNITVKKNKAFVFNGVVAAASTGYNEASGNTTGTGNVDVTTGSATVTVTITNTLTQTNP